MGTQTAEGERRSSIPHPVTRTSAEVFRRFEDMVRKSPTGVVHIEDARLCRRMGSLLDLTRMRARVGVAPGTLNATYLESETILPVSRDEDTRASLRTDNGTFGGGQVVYTYKNNGPQDETVRITDGPRTAEVRVNGRVEVTLSRNLVRGEPGSNSYFGRVIISDPSHT